MHFFSSRTEDSGLLTHKESLPVRSLVLGDIQRPGSEAVYRVGPLQCHGDRKTPYGFRLPIYLHLIYENSYYFVFILSFYLTDMNLLSLSLFSFIYTMLKTFIRPPVVKNKTK